MTDGTHEDEETERSVVDSEYPDGFYYLHFNDNDDKTLVHLYFNSDAKCRGFGFNTHDGGGFLPLSHLTEETKATKAFIGRSEVGAAFKVIKSEMIADCPSERGSYAHAWHCNIAMMCHDAILEYDDQIDFAHKVGNDAASRFMKLCFDVETKQ